jgi:hypothetical protein
VENSLNIVVYTGGTCGDLLGALIDPSSAKVTGTTMSLDPHQQKLKKPHNFNTDEEKDTYIQSVNFNSIVSHDTEYHKRRNHKFISIAVDDNDLAVWTATRFKNLHRPHVWEEMKKVGGANTIEEYAQLLIDYGGMIKEFAEHTINLSDIVSGQAIKKLNEFLTVPLQSKNLYKEWLKANKF